MKKTKAAGGFGFGKGGNLNLKSLSKGTNKASLSNPTANTTSSRFNVMNTGAQIANNSLQANVGVPNEYDINANLYGDLNKKFGDKPSLASGFLSGLEWASKKKGNQKREESLEKYNKVMDWMTGMNQDMMKRIEEQEQDERLKSQYLPEVLAYARSAKTMDPQTQKATLQSILERYNRDAGTDMQIASVDSTDPLMMMVTAPGGGFSPLDMRHLFAGQEQIQLELAQLNPEYQKQIQAQREQQEIENANAQRGFNLRQNELYNSGERNKIARDALDFRGDPNAQYIAQAGSAQGKETGAQLTKLEASNDEFYEISDRVHDLKDLLANGKVITGQTLGANLSKYFGKFTASDAYSDTELYDAVAGGLFGYVKGQEKYGNLNQNEFSFLTGRIPTSEKTKPALTRLLDQFDRKLKRSIERNNSKISRIPQYNPLKQGNQSPQAEIVREQLAPEALVGQESIAPPQSMPVTPASQANLTVKVQRPDGKIVLMDPNTAKEAEKEENGGKIIQ